MKRMELDKLLEQSPMPPQSIIDEFNIKFKKVQIHKPDLANNLQTIIPYGGEHFGNKLFEPAVKTKKQLMKKYFKIWKKKALKQTHPHDTLDGLMEVANSETSSIVYNPNHNNNVHINIDVDTASTETVSSESDREHSSLVIPIYNDVVTGSPRRPPLITDIMARSRQSIDSGDLRQQYVSRMREMERINEEIEFESSNIIDRHSISIV